VTGEDDVTSLREFGHRVRVQRVISGDLTQEQLAARAGVTRNVVSAVERGEQARIWSGLGAWQLRSACRSRY